MSAKDSESEPKQENASGERKSGRCKGFFCGKKKEGGSRFRINCFNKSATRGVRNKKVKGKVVIDQTGNNELWQKIVDNSLIGTGVVAKAAVCAIETGGIIGYNPKDFTPTVEQVKYLASSMEEPDRVSVTGIKVANLHFIYRSGLENKALFGEGVPGSEAPDHSGVIVYKGRTNLLITVYESGRGESAKKSCAELFEYFVDEQNGF